MPVAETEPHSLPNAETIHSSKMEPNSLPLELITSYLVTGDGGDHPLFSLSSGVGYSVQEVGRSGWSGFEILGVAKNSCIVLNDGIQCRFTNRNRILFLTRGRGEGLSSD